MSKIKPVEELPEWQRRKDGNLCHYCYKAASFKKNGLWLCVGHYQIATEGIGGRAD